MPESLSFDRKRGADTEQEKQIVIGSIVDTRFLREISVALKSDLLQVPYARVVFSWCVAYFNEYGEAPKNDIQDIFLTQKKGLTEADVDLITAFLLEVSESYVDQGINVDYQLDKAIRYAKRRELMSLSDGIRAYANLDKVEDAEHLVAEYRKVSKETTPWINLNDPKRAREFFYSANTNEILRFPGAVGQIFGPLERGWLCAVMGPAKRGKSWWLQEVRTLALMSGLRVVEINLEMTSPKVADRYYKRITDEASEESQYLYPVFDCARNQDGTCDLPQRMNNISLCSDVEFVPDYDDAPAQYKPCIVCRGTEEFETSTWFEPLFKDKLSIRSISKSIRGFVTQFGNGYRLKCYPRFGATLADVERDIDILAYSESFVPDVIIVDYADILLPENRRVDVRHQIDDVWKSLARLGVERHALVATATHSNLRKSEGVKNLKAGYVSEESRKMNHVDMMFVLNQTLEEQRRGIMRTGVVMHRHRDFDPARQAIVLQHLKTGQPFLDSEFRGYRQPREGSDGS